MYLFRTKTGTSAPYNFSSQDVKKKITVLVRSLESSILSSTSFQLDDTFWGVVSSTVEQSRREANLVAQGDGPEADARIPPNNNIKKHLQFQIVECIAVLCMHAVQSFCRSVCLIVRYLP